MPPRFTRLNSRRNRLLKNSCETLASSYRSPQTCIWERAARSTSTRITARRLVTIEKLHFIMRNGYESHVHLLWMSCCHGQLIVADRTFTDRHLHVKQILTFICPIHLPADSRTVKPRVAPSYVSGSPRSWHSSKNSLSHVIYFMQNVNCYLVAFGCIIH